MKKKLFGILVILCAFFVLVLPAQAAQPTNIATHVYNGQKGIIVKWRNVPGAKKYVVFRRIGSGNWAKYKEFSQGHVQFTDTKVKTYTRYSYTVRAYNKVTPTIPKDGRCLSTFRINSPTSFCAGISQIPFNGIYIDGLKGINGKQLPSKGNPRKYINILVSKDKNFPKGKSVDIYADPRGMGQTIYASLKSAKINERYFIKIREAFKINGKIYYGGWSPIKNITAKEPVSGGVYKPIIYLYPEEETEINVQAGYPEKFTVSYPEYQDGGWNVTASPDGKLVMNDTGLELYSLYYEAETDTDVDVTDPGFCVAKEDIAAFLEEKLSVLGLNYKEREEFIVYWLPELQKTPYTYISFMSEEETEKQMPLNINPAPDTLIRVWMKFKGLDKAIDVQEQQLKKVERTGYTAVEWGGIK